MKIITQKTKTLIAKPNNNSSDFISPNYVYGCAGGCMKSYCYVGRYNSDKVYINTNIDDIFMSCSNAVKDLPWPKVPNQQDLVYYMTDIGCNSDLALHQKHINFKDILVYYDKHRMLNSTFATKYSHMLTLDVTSFRKKPRVRISLMPIIYSLLLEPKTTSIEQRIKDIGRLQKLGWEVHLNFSPVICYPGWEDVYKEMFNQINQSDFDKSTVKCEVIFLTNHTNSPQHELMKYSTEIKNTSGVMRYPMEMKRILKEQFINLHAQIIPWCEIRYIF